MRILLAILFALALACCSDDDAKPVADAAPADAAAVDAVKSDAAPVEVDASEDKDAGAATE